MFGYADVRVAESGAVVCHFMAEARNPWLVLVHTRVCCRSKESSHVKQGFRGDASGCGMLMNEVSHRCVLRKYGIPDLVRHVHLQKVCCCLGHVSVHGSDS